MWFAIFMPQGSPKLYDVFWSLWSHPASSACLQSADFSNHVPGRECAVITVCLDQRCTTF